MKGALKQLLDRLDAIYERDDDLTDTEVREEMFKAIANGFILQTPSYVVPSDFYLYKQPGCNTAVQTALVEFIAASSAAAKRDGLVASQQRLDAFQDESVLSDQEHPFYWYFGSVDDLEQLDDLIA